LTDVQPVVPAAVKSFSRKRLISQSGDDRADSAHAVLIMQVSAR
jgi:hypothetical protein